MKKKLLAMILAALLTLALGSTVAFAAAGDPNAEGHDPCVLRVELVDRSGPIYRAPVYIWKIADVTGSDANLHYEPAEKFKPFFEAYIKEHLADLNGTNWETSENGWDWSSWDRFAETFITSNSATIRIIIDENQIEADNMMYTDANGEAVFTEVITDNTTNPPKTEDLTTGLYLVRIPRLVRDTGPYTTSTYIFQTALVLVPGGYIEDNGTIKLEWEWEYDVTVIPKMNRNDVTNEPPPDIPTPPPEPPTPPDEPPTPPEEPPTPPEEPPTPPEEPPTPPEEPIPEEPVPLVYPPEEEIPEEPTPLTPPEEPEEEIPDEEIPLTGQLWWPVPAMGAGGVVCVGIGSLLSKKKDDEDDL
ncbi:MAG: hypothetical protein IJQ02_13770 [Oscillospiraceae bacterium]|nr:hypothetical protein [Oscillospiraceae bacterium]